MDERTHSHNEEDFEFAPTPEEVLAIFRELTQGDFIEIRKPKLSRRKEPKVVLRELNIYIFNSLCIRHLLG